MRPEGGQHRLAICCSKHCLDVQVLPIAVIEFWQVLLDGLDGILMFSQSLSCVLVSVARQAV